MSHVALVLIAAACACGEAPPPNHPTAAKRVITARSRLPRALQPLLPVHGIYAAGSSHASPTWRIIVDTDRHTIWAGTSKASVPSFGPLEHEATKELSPRNRVFLTQIAEDAWREPPAEPPDPRAETGETFVVLDDEDALYLQDAGPIRRPAAARAIIELRAAAGL